MIKYLRYLRYVCVHKYFVYRAGCALGVGRWQLLVHDLSKFRADEFVAYARYFYGGTPSAATKEAFDRAWLAHQHRNPHHWQHWCLREDSGAFKTLAMPVRYAREMVSDWRGAGQALGKPDTRGWYLRNRDHIILHPVTRLWVEQRLGIDTRGARLDEGAA